ncbi:MAG: magnesium transporter [Thermomicrobiales bacterium]
MASPYESRVTVAASLLDDIREAVASGDATRAQALAARMLEEDALALLRDLAPAELSRLFAILGDEALANLLARLDDLDAASILSRMSAAQAADILEEIDPDDATDIFAAFEPAVGDTILVLMEAAEAAEIRELMAYPPDTAGGIMTPAFVALAPDLRADQAIAALRRVAEEAETVNYVYVVDPDDRLLGVLSLHRLVLTPPSTPVRDLMATDIVTVPVDADQEVAAHIVTEHDLLAVPVVDAQNRLVGIITADDVADVLEEEATEDIERLGGSSPLAVPYLRASPRLLFRKRIVWLLALFLAQFVTLSIYNRYTGMLEEQVLLALFVPILIGTGGNVGSQTVTTIIRAMAVGEVAPRHALQIVAKESVTAVALGLVMAALMFGRGLWESDGSIDFGLTVGATVMALIVWSAIVAAVLPLALSKFKLDPAVVSAPLITSLVDATGIIIYFSVAQAVMQVG